MALNKMMWECERHDWAALAAQGSARSVPRALADLAHAASDDEALKAYWRIDNTVVVQGALYEAAVATASCAVSLLQECTPAARPRMLELLVQIGAGEPALGQPADLDKRCVTEVLRGAASYFHCLEVGSENERIACVDLLGLCSRADVGLQPRVKWYFERLLRAEAKDCPFRELMSAWLEEMR